MQRNFQIQLDKSSYNIDIYFVQSLLAFIIHVLFPSSLLQGMFIFVAHCWMNESVRTSFMRFYAEHVFTDA